jgi:translocation and assembly module TamA
MFTPTLPPRLPTMLASWQCLSQCLLLSLLWLWQTPLMAAVVSVDIEGVNGAARDNIAAAPILLALQSAEALKRQRLRRARPAIIEQSIDALKPFGYYNPRVTVKISGESPNWRLLISVQPGEPIQVNALNITLSGPGQEDKLFREWRKNWPLPTGSILLQQKYEQAKQDLLQRARRHGYIAARLLKARIEVDPGINSADISLHLDTGARAVFGTVTDESGIIQDHTMSRLQPFAEGDFYDAELMDDWRVNLAASGYFDRIDIIERLSPEADPPRVDLALQLQARPKNTYTIGAGLGTDTGPRLTTGWDIHRLNRRGDTLSMGFGVQATDMEFFTQAEYLRPIGDDPGEFLFASASMQRKDDDFEFIDTASGEAVFPEIDGTRFNQLINTGFIRQFEPWDGWSAHRRLFVGFLNESFNTEDPPADSRQSLVLEENPELLPFLNESQQVLHAGFSWQVQKISGQGFNIEGTNALWRVIGAVDGALSDISFLQSYMGLNYQRLLHKNGKLIMSAEFGYTEAKVNNFLLEQGGDTLDFSLTSLPERFRFQAGGDRSVRGYGYQSLSNNRNGSNHLLTGSIEYEHRLTEDWSVAVFSDAGNAFNDFSRPELQWSAGLGARYYTAVGPIRLDLARQLDTGDNALRIHLTIGTPLVTFGSLPILSGVQ